MPSCAEMGKRIGTRIMSAATVSRNVPTLRRRRLISIRMMMGFFEMDISHCAMASGIRLLVSIQPKSDAAAMRNKMPAVLTADSVKTFMIVLRVSSR